MARHQTAHSSKTTYKCTHHATVLLLERTAKLPQEQHQQRQQRRRQLFQSLLSQTSLTLKSVKSVCLQFLDIRGTQQQSERARSSLDVSHCLLLTGGGGGGTSAVQLVCSALPIVPACLFPPLQPSARGQQYSVIRSRVPARPRVVVGIY